MPCTGDVASKSVVIFYAFWELFHLGKMSLAENKTRAVVDHLNTVEFN